MNYPLAPRLFLSICLFLTLSIPVQAEKLYKHRDANGTIVFSDRQPDAPNFEVSQVSVESVRSRFGLRKVGEDENCRLEGTWGRTKSTNRNCR